MMILAVCGMLFFPAFARAEDPAMSQAASTKLDEVLKGQNEILRQLGEIKQELEIVKIRASNR